MSEICTPVAPGQSLKSFQKIGLESVARLHGGRDVVLAIDLTESVGLNDEGHLRLRQIVEDSLKSGDTVYVVPFATKTNPLTPEINPLTLETAIQFKGKADVEKILQLIPFQPDLRLQNTDIQQAELRIYQGLADLNQCRLTQNQPIKPQSVVWITDAPLFTKS
ncbi:MAG: VWA domain-containing protein, partial [Planktothrix sp.]